MWKIWIDKSIPILSLWDKTVTRTWWWRGEKGRLWTHFTRSSSRPAAAAPRFVSLLLWETWRLILPRWTCLCKGDCRRLPCCSGSSPSLAWVSVHVYTLHVHWKHWKRCKWWSISEMVQFIKDKSALIRCFFTVGLQTCWIWKVCWIWKQEKCWLARRGSQVAHDLSTVHSCTQFALWTSGYIILFKTVDISYVVLLIFSRLGQVSVTTTWSERSFQPFIHNFLHVDLSACLMTTFQEVVV